MTFKDRAENNTKKDVLKETFFSNADFLKEIVKYCKNKNRCP